ncbi:MAG: biotin/lipoate A/B protein ligase family protein [Planctomycetota bacterium]|nr:biotin/lipoate A/B protein ligase family protein [Planctomycetota bacterium]
METWRVITTWGADPAFNMGLDEALTHSSDALTTLRFYTWKPDTLSLGYFQKLADVPGHAEAKAIVRRITGGGAIHHVDELTFSISTAADHALYSGPIADSYVRIHSGLCSALAVFGVAAEMRGKRSLASDQNGTGMCFHHSTDLDIVWNDRKGVGSAQRRTQGRVLHHGSIKIGTSKLEGDIATLRASTQTIDVHALAEAVKASFAAAFGVTLEAGVPDERERIAARELGKRYVSREFVEKR